MNKKNKLIKIIAINISIFLIIGIIMLINKSLNINVLSDNVEENKKYVESAEMTKNFFNEKINDAGTKISESADMINELAIGHTLLFESDQLVNSYTNKNIVFNITISEIDYETEVDIETLINSLIESVGEENAQSVIDGINNGEIYSLEGFPDLKSFKIIMKDPNSGNILKQVDLSNEIKNNAIETQLMVEQNCIIGIEGIIRNRIEFYDSEGNINMESSWDDIYTSERFLTINQIDKVVPTMKITPNGATTSQSQNVTITVEDNGGSGLSINNSYQYQLGTSNTVAPTGIWQNYTSGTEFTIGNGLTGDYYLWIKTIIDNAGNESAETEYIVSNKFTFDNSEEDKIAPELSIEYSTTQFTNKSVTATIKSNEEIQEVVGWTISEDAKTLTKIYTTNTTENVDVYDIVGNKATIQVKIANIDTTKPELRVEYSITQSTNKSVTATISANEQIQEVDGWNLSEDKMTLTKEYTGNTDEEITVKDLVGNEIKVSILIKNIDKTAPEIDVEYSTQDKTKDTVTVTIVSNEQIQQLEGWTISEDCTTLTKIYTENIDESIEVYDLAGNKATIQVKIANIDKTEIEATVEYSTTILTNKNVTVTIILNKEIQEIDEWTLSEDKKTLTKEYIENATENVKLQDFVGNEREIKISVQNIDKLAPKVNVEYSTLKQTNKSITVSIIADEELQSLDGWSLEEDGKTLTKKYERNSQETVKVYDIAGNEIEVEISVNNIDKTNKQEAEKTDTENSNEQDTAPTRLPDAGSNTLIGVIIITIIVSIVLWTKNRKFKDIK